MYRLVKKKTQLILIKQEIEKEEENLQVVLGQMSKYKTELKNILDMLQLENNELQGLKLQHDQKMSELEKTQVEVLEVIKKAILPLTKLQSLSSSMFEFSFI